MNDDSALKFQVPAIFCGLKGRFHFTPKLTLLNQNLLKERSYRTMLETLPTPPPFPVFPVLRSYFRVPFPYASFLLSERLEYAWINCALKMAYSAGRQYSQKSLIWLGPPYFTRILLGIPI